MIISGLQTTTLLDYPGKVAATIFTGCCNFRCPFCQNADLVLSPENQYPDSEILAFLRKRKNVLEGVCITGGEPTLQKDLMEFLCKIKSIGYEVKLDTNGYRPEVLRTLIEGNLIDYIAMDIKASPSNYNMAAGIDIDINIIKQSVSIIMNSGLPYEFRTTLVKGIHKDNEMVGIRELIAGAGAYYLQSYKDSDNIISKVNGSENSLGSFSLEELNEFLHVAREFSDASLRGID